MRRFSQENPRPRNRRVTSSGRAPWTARLKAWFSELHLPQRLIPKRLRSGISWSMNQRTAARTAAMAVVAGWAMLTVIGFVRAWSLEGPYEDRAEELSNVVSQLSEARAHTVLLESQLKAIDKRAEVRMSVIRQELGMVRPNERIVRFRGAE
mgnify:CR=1 FL=1